MQITNAESKRALKSRLRRVAGQLEGIVDMIEEDRECADIAIQLSACRNALQHALGAFTTCAIAGTQTSKRATENTKEINRLLTLLI